MSLESSVSHAVWVPASRRNTESCSSNALLPKPGGASTTMTQLPRAPPSDFSMLVRWMSLCPCRGGETRERSSQVATAVPAGESIIPAFNDSSGRWKAIIAHASRPLAPESPSKRTQGRTGCRSAARGMPIACAAADRPEDSPLLTRRRPLLAANSDGARGLEQYVADMKARGQPCDQDSGGA